MDAKRKIEEENEISIPFSTIKSMTGLYNHIIRRLFQFHLVRLKEHHPVSENPVHAFQFHLVRLKGQCNNILRIQQVFQFQATTRF